MDDLVAFLRTRLDEDEEVARLADAVDPGPWYDDVEDGSYTNQREGLDGVGLVRAADNVGLWDREQSAGLSMAGVTATHIARHDPARVLREVEAKRQILSSHGGDFKEQGMFGNHCEHDTPCPTLRSLAAMYADHLGYRPEWAPDA